MSTAPRALFVNAQRSKQSCIRGKHSYLSILMSSAQVQGQSYLCTSAPGL